MPASRVLPPCSPLWGLAAAHGHCSPPEIPSLGRDSVPWRGPLQLLGQESPQHCRHPQAPSCQHSPVSWAGQRLPGWSFLLLCRAQFFHHERAPALQTCTTCVRRWTKTFLGRFKIYRYSKWRRKGLSWPFLYLPDKNTPMKGRENPFSSSYSINTSEGKNNLQYLFSPHPRIG